ncbi:Calx-beta domain-containing protein [Rheinheimera sp. MM224]|uniref:Calx-beta domain-containing protein n=1 Tax=Rheinheimera sp. MM224 TaxID=3019969 RepID=UPI0021F83C5D|nr:Calx-beta domain-containing protein [Rheinheimera sp. MM224]CAI3803074.1 hypothetical protein JAMGFMIE_03267 [Rheinheimera sp. MM224]
MKFTALHVVLSSTLMLQSSLLSATNLNTVIDHGPLVTPATEAFKKALDKQSAKKLLAQANVMANASGEPAIIDVGVVMHSSWIEAMKDPITTDANGKYYENGAQFALARIKAQFDYFNETLQMQSVNARVRPAYFASVDSETVASGGITQLDEFNNVLVCVFFADNHPSYSGLAERCQVQGLTRVRDIVQGQVDLVYYIREQLEGDDAAGRGAYFSGPSVYDSYRIAAKTAKSEGATESRLNDLRFGFYNASIFSHESGHVMGAMHEVWADEPTFPDGHNRAYACGVRADGVPRVDNDLESRRKTIMWHELGDHHRFFSDEDIVVDGDHCGVRGEANNIEYVRINAPLVAQNFTMNAPTSTVGFVMDTIIVGRQEGKATLMLRRTGDLTMPAYLSMTAKDGTAWENRDFTFGLKEIAFAAGEAEKSVDITLLPRSKGHSDTKFTVVFQAAMGATYNATEAEITILSDKAIQAGSVQFALASTNVMEGDTAQMQINRLNGTDGDITFKVTATDGTGVKGTDYAAETVVKTLKDGESSAMFDVSTTKRQGLQGDRTVSLSISEVAGGAVLGQIGQATLNIKDVAENGSLSFSAATASVNENATVTLTISRTNGTDGEVGVRMQSVNGTALAGTDFTAVDQVVTIPAGQASATVVIAMTNRTGSQGSRYFDVVLSNATGGAALGATTTTRITVSDVTTAPPTESDSSGGGSLGTFSLLGLVLLAIRRLKITK